MTEELVDDVAAFAEAIEAIEGEDAEEYFTEAELEIFGELIADEGFQSLEGLNLAIEEPPPKGTRKPRVSEPPWEQYLNFLKAKPGVTVKLFQFDSAEDPEEVTKENKHLTAKGKARYKQNAMRRRLAKFQPKEVFFVEAKEIKADGSWRVYARYERKATKEEVTERLAKVEAAKERGRHAAATRTAKS